MEFIKRVKESATKNVKRIVLPESNDPRVLEAASIIAKEGVAVPVLIGAKEEIGAKAKELNLNLEGVEVVDNKSDSNLDSYVDTLVKIREKKGLTKEDAYKILTSDVNFYGAMLVRQGVVDGMVSGSDSPTSNILRAGIQVVGTKAGVRTVSSVFLMELTQKQDIYGDLLVFGDCAVIPEPTSAQLADIAIGAADTARSVAGIDPRVALMSFSTMGSAKHGSVDVVKEAKEIIASRDVDFSFDGEMQADAALVASVGTKKAPNSKVAGKANVLIFPNLAAGNIGYKLVQRLAGAAAHGPLLQGLAKPINDLSRGCSVDDIVNLAAITAVQGK